jgi:hypothetical protein
MLLHTTTHRETVLTAVNDEVNVSTHAVPSDTPDAVVHVSSVVQFGAVVAAVGVSRSFTHIPIPFVEVSTQ